MKKYIFLLVSVLAFTFTSCTDGEEIDIKYQIDVTVDPSTVQSAFHGYSVSGTTYGLNMDEDSELLITSLVYNTSGELIDKKESIVKDYHSKINFSLKMSDDEQLTVITVSYSIDKINDLESYSIENEERIEKLSITSNYGTGNSYYSNWMMLGVAKQEISSSRENVIIEIQPASALVVINYNDIHAFDDAGIDTHWIAYKNNNQARFNGNLLSFGSNSSVNSGYVMSCDVTQNSGNNIFEIAYLLPTENMTVWGGFSMGENDSSYSSFLSYAGLDPALGEATIDIKAGGEYLFVVNCDECSIEVGPMTRAISTSSENFFSMKQVEKEQKVTNLQSCKRVGQVDSVNMMELVKNIY